jgi:hypothetical protein
MSPTKKQMQDLLRDRFGEVEIVCESPVIHGTVTMAPLGVLGVLLVWADETGKKFATQVPFGTMLVANAE